MSYYIICPSCKQENFGTALKCINCQASLEETPRMERPPTEAEIASYQKATYEKKLMMAEEKIKTESIFKGSASNFYWIAGLSILNSLVFYLGGNFNFVLGLAFTQFVDGFAGALAKDLSGNGPLIIQIVGFIFDLIVAGVFVVFGVFANKRHKWAFIVGIVLYMIDGILFLLFKDFLSFGFHVFILVGLFSGYKSIKKLDNIQGQISINNKENNDD